MFPKICKERSKIRLTPLETISIIYRSNGVDFLRQQNFAAEKSIFVVWKTVAKICNFFHTTNIDFSASAKFCKNFALLKTQPRSHIIHSRPPLTFTLFVIFVACTNSKILIFPHFFYLAGRLLFSTPTPIFEIFASSKWLCDEKNALRFSDFSWKSRNRHRSSRRFVKSSNHLACITCFA